MLNESTSHIHYEQQSQHAVQEKFEVYCEDQK
jgi:hypothetical protein